MPKNGNIILSQWLYYPRRRHWPEKTSVVLKEEWEQGLVELVENSGAVLTYLRLNHGRSDLRCSNVVSGTAIRILLAVLESCDVENGFAVTLYEVQIPSMGKDGNYIYGSDADNLEHAIDEALGSDQTQMTDLIKRWLSMIISYCILPQVQRLA